MEKRITGLGGVFLKFKEPKLATAWYDKHLGTSFGDQTYQTFEWRDLENPDKKCQTAFSLFSDGSEYFAPSKGSFMMNFRVEDLEGLLETLKGEGVTVVGEIEQYGDFGKFAWILDPEGNKIELWAAAD